MNEPYDQEQDDYTCVHCDNDPCACYEVPDRFFKLMEKLRQCEFIDPESIHYAVLGAQETFKPDIQAEFDAWMQTTDGKFAQYRAEHGCR